jgi:hypothetical protein
MLQGVRHSEVPRAYERSLVEVTDALVGSTTRRALLDTLHRYIKSLFPDPYSSLWIADEERIPTWLLLVAEFGNRTADLASSAQKNNCR